MRIRLNDEAVTQLSALMDRLGHTNPTHTLQVLISTVTNNLNKSKKHSPSEDKHHGQPSKKMQSM
jgi:hypothetical protein